MANPPADPLSRQSTAAPRIVARRRRRCRRVAPSLRPSPPPPQPAVPHLAGAWRHVALERRRTGTPHRPLQRAARHRHRLRRTFRGPPCRRISTGTAASSSSAPTTRAANWPPSRQMLRARGLWRRRRDLTFYAHAKGVKYEPQFPPAVRRWAEVQYAVTLDDWRGAARATAALRNDRHLPQARPLSQPPEPWRLALQRHLLLDAPCAGLPAGLAERAAVLRRRRGVAGRAFPPRRNRLPAARQPARAALPRSLLDPERRRRGAALEGGAAPRAGAAGSRPSAAVRRRRLTAPRTEARRVRILDRSAARERRRQPAHDWLPVRRRRMARRASLPTARPDDRHHGARRAPVGGPRVGVSPTPAPDSGRR